MSQKTEDREMLEVIVRRNERSNFEQIDVGGKIMTVLHKGYAERYPFDIEKFVQDIEASCEGGFIAEVTRYGIERIRELDLGRQYYDLLNSWLQQYSDIFSYSARVELFYDVCKELGLIGDYPFWFDEPGDTDGADGVRYMELFNVLIEQIRVRCQSREFKERERLRKKNAERNMRNVLAMEEAMFEAKSRWLILSLTLAYKPEFRGEITPETIQEHRDRFFAARRCNKLMSGVRNYVWTIEQGEQTGLHLHVILFYSPDSNHDEFIARQIGEYWVDVVTGGRGDYWNSNDGRLKRKYEKRGHGIGVGQINRGDGKRKALQKNLTYLAKAQQYVMIRGAERIRTFDMGRVPQKVKSGRPRADSGMRPSGIDGVAAG
ncbi:inovirus-type Gp2 protein [Cupriavidus sp. AcVe19-6a]|uniref:inovirus-type Gp2 protein n=1 Tax=Cupriavidus sp. AcVe19-6a TaxID=2821358 RepID=UPI001AE9681C|nr:inovirus-type Gp2 protein [Cupriavidus sp. AcVe19-6a]MBP0635905.1 inovirus-type Gp2 protein [Cupriavidus sp. AcVe19-6a]